MTVNAKTTVKALVDQANAEIETIAAEQAIALHGADDVTCRWIIDVGVEPVPFVDSRGA